MLEFPDVAGEMVTGQGVDGISDVLVEKWTTITTILRQFCRIEKDFIIVKVFGLRIFFLKAFYVKGLRFI